MMIWNSNIWNIPYVCTICMSHICQLAPCSSILQLFQIQLPWVHPLSHFIGFIHCPTNKFTNCHTSWDSSIVQFPFEIRSICTFLSSLIVHFSNHPLSHFLEEVGPNFTQIPQGQSCTNFNPHYGISTFPQGSIMKFPLFMESRELGHFPVHQLSHFQNLSSSSIVPLLKEVGLTFSSVSGLSHIWSNLLEFIHYPTSQGSYHVLRFIVHPCIYFSSFQISKAFSTTCMQRNRLLMKINSIMKWFPSHRSFNTLT